MLATFCVRLALGLVASLLLLSSRQLHPRFFRTHFLTVLGLLALATLAAWPDAAGVLRALLVSGTVLGLLGALAWTLEPAPGGQSATVLTVVALTGALAWLEVPPPEVSPVLPPAGWAAVGTTSAAFLGAGLSAMLVGHSYLISPGMALTPLMKMLAALAVTALVRAAVCGAGLWCWTATYGTDNLTSEVGLWLPVRWVVGVVAPLGFGWMAYSAAKIRSTQSATGILYVVVVCSFLGELLSLLLTRQTGMPL